jgi:hypothetical protein
MLCLSSTVSVWSNEVVPTLVARWAQKRLWPLVTLIAKKVKRRPVVIFGAVGAAYLAFWPWLSRLNFAHFNSCSLHNLFRYVVHGAMPAVAHVEVLNRPALILALYNFPRLIPAALWARVVWPFKGLCNHETLPILR